MIYVFINITRSNKHKETRGVNTGDLRNGKNTIIED